MITLFNRLFLYYNGTIPLTKPQLTDLGHFVSRTIREENPEFVVKKIRSKEPTGIYKVTGYDEAYSERIDQLIREYEANSFKLPEPISVPKMDYIEKVKPLMDAMEKKFPEILNKEPEYKPAIGNEYPVEKKRERKRIPVKPKAIIVHSEKINK